MAQAYVPIYLDWTEVTRELNAQEKGRLIDAIVLYAKGGDWQEQIKGNERYLFPAFQGQIDRSRELSEIRTQAGIKGGRPKQTEPNETKANQTKPKQTKTTKEEKEEKEKEEEYSPPISPRKAEGRERFERFWKAYPRKVGKPAAEKVFLGINPDEQALTVILNAIAQQKTSRQWQEDEGRYIPHPTTWLRQRRWEDEQPAAPETVYAGNDDYGGDLF